MNAIDPIISKITKLLTTAADSGATEHERRTALLIAQRLMSQHRVSEAALKSHAAAEAAARGEVNADDMVVGYACTKKTRACGWLAMAVGKLCGCGVYSSQHTERLAPGTWGYKTVKNYQFYGLPHDIAVARELLAAIQAEMLAKSYAWADEQNTSNDRKLSKRSIPVKAWQDGFATALLDKACKEAERRKTSTESIRVELPAVAGPVAAGAEPVQALVLFVAESEQQVQTERALVRKAAKIGLAKGRARSYRTDWSAREQGAAAGRATSLSRGGVR